jgi:hypothetical protein
MFLRAEKVPVNDKGDKGAGSRGEVVSWSGEHRTFVRMRALYTALVVISASHSTIGEQTAQDTAQSCRNRDVLASGHRCTTSHDNFSRPVPWLQLQVSPHRRPNDAPLHLRDLACQGPLARQLPNESLPLLPASFTGTALRSAH